MQCSEALPGRTRIGASRLTALALLAMSATAGCDSGVQGHERPPRAEPTAPPGNETPGSGGSGQTSTPPGTGGSVGGGTGGSSGNSGPGASTGGKGAGGSGAVAEGGSMGSMGGGGSPGTDAVANTPPASGVTIMINGKAVPKEKAIVLLHVGHSNMSGRAQGPADLKPYFYETHPNLWKYAKGGVWTPAKEVMYPDGAPDRNFPQGAGPAMAMLRRGLESAPDAHFISIGNGQSLNYGTSCFSYRKGGIHHANIIAAALELKGKVTFAALFTMLGYDGRTNARAQNGGYLECMKGLIADFRTALEEPELPYLVGDYERGATDGFSPNTAGAKQVIAQLAQVPGAVPRSYLIPTENVAMQDNHHYNMLGHKQWSDLAFKHLVSAGWAPWATVK